MTTTSAPMPACRCRESLTMPSDKPTISRISVTSRPTATTLISDRTGRCTRLPTIILFIMGMFSGVSAPYAPGQEPSSLANADFRVPDGLLGIASVRHLGRGGGLAQVHHLGTGRLLQLKLIRRQGLIQLELHNIEGDVVSLARPLDLCLRGEADAPEVLVVSVVNVGHEVPLLIVNELAMGLEIHPAEDNFTRQEPSFLLPPDDDDLIIRLLDPVTPRIEHGLVTVLQYRDFVLRVNLANQQGIVKHLGPQ